MTRIHRNDLEQGRIDLSALDSGDRLPPIHPGDVLREDFLAAMGMTQYALAKAMKVDPRRINEIVQGKRAVSADTALRLSLVFGTTAEFWMNLQSQHDLATARTTLGDTLSDVKPVAA